MRTLILGAGPQTDADVAPVWLLENGGELLIERLVRACAGLGTRLAFAVRTEEIRRHRIDSVIEQAAPGAALVAIPADTAGAACTALLCLRQIDPGDELLLLNSTEYLDIDYAGVIAGFRARRLDCGVVTFPSLHPRYSYVRLDEDGLVLEAAEKNPISRHATPGFHWFARGADFVAAAQDMVRKDASVDGRFYISLTLNEMVLRQRRVGVHPIAARHYHPLKSPRQHEVFETDELMELRA